MRRLLVALALLASGCGSSASTIGPLTLEPPEGWLVTDRQLGTIKVTNGTVGDGTGSRRGTATAVFDVYVDSGQDLVDLREVLEENNVESEEERLTIGGYDAVIVSFPTTPFSPASEVAFVPEWDVRIVYRAAYGDQQAEFERHRPAFRRALDSISFRGRPAPQAWGGRASA